MKIIIEIETNEAENDSEFRKKMHCSLEDTMFGIIKENVEGIIERSHFTSDYFKSCKVTKE